MYVSGYIYTYTYTGIHSLTLAALCLWFRALVTGLASLVLAIPLCISQVKQNSIYKAYYIILQYIVKANVEAQNYWLPIHLIYVELECAFD